MVASRHAATLPVGDNRLQRTIDATSYVWQVLAVREIKFVRPINLRHSETRLEPTGSVARKADASRARNEWTRVMDVLQLAGSSPGGSPPGLKTDSFARLDRYASPR